MKKPLFLAPLALGAAALLVAGSRARPADLLNDLDFQVPDERVKTPFKDEVPIVFLNRSQNAKEWDKLPGFWNEATEAAFDPRTGEPVTRRVVRIKVPLGLTQNPPVPPENPLTLAKWSLGKRLYYDAILSSDSTISCATCHNPTKGFTDQAAFSTGIKGQRGGMSAPTVVNAAYNPLQFWDGRAVSLEDQAQGPVGNSVEMFGGGGDHAWHSAIKRIRSRPDYVRQFRAAFGHDPTRDAAAKAIAAYERTVLNGNSVHDRAELAMRRRVEEEGTVKFAVQAKDYEAVLKDAFASKDRPALSALGLDADKDGGRLPDVAGKIARGRELFFGKARCNSCHIGDVFTDNIFHNLGVGVKDGKLPGGATGRFGALPTGHKNPELIGAFKTPTLRGLAGTGPYMHDGSEKTLEQVIDFYDKGGNANEFLDVKMRDYEAEKAFELARRNKTEYKGPPVQTFGKDQKPIVPLKLNLTPEEKADLALFVRALEGDPVNPIVGDPERFPK